MTIETAVVAPVLIIMSLGVFETGSIVARQHELQSAANEATIIVMAANRGPEVEISEMKAIISESVGLSGERIVLEREYRCNASNGKVKSQGACPSNATISSYITVSLTDTHTPVWTAFGVGEKITFKVDRSVQVS
ncbi:TadE/TadG family type IV pilus assembly protein [Erythrobacter sp. GH1-10]|uniref:TadE/TadG family type IV pilus assembly protein n=1 Tax=Erythrobacter sp. GH1-10 TaxID=3349334 RepID=UPI00387791B5